jgi:hypothetical protein
MLQWVRETRWHHANHGGHCVPECDGRSDHVVATAESTLPHVVPEHDHTGSTRDFVGVEQRTTEQRRHTSGLECGGSKLRSLDQRGSRVVDDEIAGVRPVRPQVVDCLQLAPPFEEIPYDARLRRVGQGVLRLDQDEAIAFGQRDRRREDLTDQVVIACAHPDRDGERQSAGERQARVFQEHPNAELVVLQHVSARQRKYVGQP